MKSPDLKSVTSVAAVILAGGQGSRMGGEDKGQELLKKELVDLVSQKAFYQLVLDVRQNMRKTLFIQKI